MESDLLALTADIISAHVSNNAVSAADMPGLIAATYAALQETCAAPVEAAPTQEPAVAIRSSIKRDYLVCLEDGAKLKMLKRYLRTNYDMSPEDYRAKWKLPRDYPMVAPAYAEQRRTLAKQIGLGQKKEDITTTKPAKPAKTAKSMGTGKPRGRPKKLAVKATTEAAAG